MISKPHRLICFFKPVSIRGKLLLFFGVSIAALFALMGGINYFGLPLKLYEGEYRRGKEAAFQRLNVTADEKKENIVHWFEERLVGVKICVGDSMRMAYLRKHAALFRSTGGVPKPDPRLEEWLNSVRDTFQYDAVEIVDSASGLRIYSTQEDQPAVKSPVYSELFSDGADWADKIFMTREEKDNRSCLYLAYLDRIESSDGKADTPPVALLFRIDMDNPYLVKILHGSELLGATGEIVLIDMHKRLLAPLKNPLPNGATASLLEYRFSSRDAEFAAWGIDGVIESTDYRGKSVIAAVRHHRLNPEFGLGIIVKQDDQEIFAPLRREIYTSLIVICGGLVTLQCILFLMATVLLKPLETLNSAVSRIESRDLEARVKVESNDECGLLAEAFNRMADNILQWHVEFEAQVYAQTEEIRALNTELEQRVENRTAALEASNRELEKAYIDLKSAQAHLLQRDKMASIGQLAAGVAHEINNPMGFIMSNLNTLKDYADSVGQFCIFLRNMVEKNCGDEDLQALQEKIKKLDIEFIMGDIGPLISQSTEGADRVKRIVLDLKDFAREENNTFELTDLNACIRTAVNMVNNEIKYVADLDLRLGDIPKINCSRHQINQVLVNMLVNARHAIEKHGTITVVTQKVGEQVVVSLTDTGCGMTEENRKRIFDPFFTTKKVGEGTGLGLSISYGIIKKHGGDITVESEPGAGTTFTVTLPINGMQEVMGG